MISSRDLTAVILAGGKAQKSGTGPITSMLEVEGRKIIERQAQLLKPKVSRIEVSVSAPAQWSRFPTVVDEFDPVGPLAGMATALKFASTDYLLFISAEYAWIKSEVLDLLVARAGDPFDGCAVRIGYTTPKPLFSIMHKRAAPRAIARLERGEHDAVGLFTSESLAVRWIEDYELESFDPGLTSFRVVDVPRDDSQVAEVKPVAEAAPVCSEGGGKFSFQATPAYQSALAFVPVAHAVAKATDPELAAHLRRSAHELVIAIAQGSPAKTAAFACVALLDAARALGITDRIDDGEAVLAKLVDQLG